jgi:hypothetical protein
MNSLLVPLTYPYNNSSGSVTIPISNPAATTSAKAKPVYNKAETAGAGLAVRNQLEQRFRTSKTVRES